MSILIKGMEMPKSCMDCPFKGFDRAKGRGNICTINDSITLHAVLDGIDVKFVRMGDCPLVPVVRCKDCKWRKKEFGWNGKEYWVCDKLHHGFTDDFYCADGERKDDEPE